MRWRPPGYFSGPLLANPRFRNIFLAKTKDILERVYTPDVYFPLIDATADRLREDVTLRARARGEDARVARLSLAHNVELLKTHLLRRRQVPAGAAGAARRGPGQHTIVAVSFYFARSASGRTTSHTASGCRAATCSSTRADPSDGAGPAPNSAGCPR